MSMKKRLTELSQDIKFDYILPDSHKSLTIIGSSNFIKDMREMLDLMVHSPTALRIFNYNAHLPKPLSVEEFKNALDLGRNTGTHIQVAYGKTQNGRMVSKYDWISLLPHEMRHSYNIPKLKSHILNAIGYAITNELDAQAIGAAVALEIDQYIETHKKSYPNTEEIKKELYKDPRVGYFKELYDKAKGNAEDKKREAIEQYALGVGQKLVRFGKDYKTFSELAYKISIERDTTAHHGWKRMSDAEFDKLESCLLGKIKPEKVATEAWMQGRENIQDERDIIKKEWPTFCQRLMNGTYRTDVIPYFQNIKPTNLIQLISPKLSEHLKKTDVIPHPKALERKTPTHE